MGNAFRGIENPKVAYIGAANNDDPSFYKMAQPILKEAGAADVVFVHLAKKKVDISAAKNILADSDVIFLAGGDVEDGMKWLTQCDLIDFLKDLYRAGKRFMGISAGVIMMGAHWVCWDNPEDDTSARIFDCLGFIPAVFDVHGEDDDWVELKTALKLLGKGSRGYALPRDSMITADSQGNFVNVKKKYLSYVFDEQIRLL